jgi:hypothetical protein
MSVIELGHCESDKLAAQYVRNTLAGNKHVVRSYRHEPRICYDR